MAVQAEHTPAPAAAAAVAEAWPRDDAFLAGDCSQPFTKRLQQQQDCVLADWLVLVSTGMAAALPPPPTEATLAPVITPHP